MGCLLKFIAEEGTSNGGPAVQEASPDKTVPESPDLAVADNEAALAKAVFRDLCALAQVVYHPSFILTTHMTQ